MEGSEAFELSFQGDAYSIAIAPDGARLVIEAQHLESLDTWRGEFSAQHLEEITQRTHNFKSFPVFVHMLLTALRRESDSVFVDLLTYADLELLKSKRAGAAAGGSAAAAQPGSGAGGSRPDGSAQPANTKRYLILTYAAEFDRVHYPLPLLQQEPDPQRLKAMIQQLRQHLGGSGGPRRMTGGGSGAAGAELRRVDVAPGEVRALREENSTLRQQLCALETRLVCGATSDVQQLTADAQETVKDLRQMRKERDALLLRAQQAEAALEGERNLHRRELRRKLKEQQELAAELVSAKEQIRELRLKCRELTQELDLTQRRAKVANLSASYLERAREVGPRPAARSAATTPARSRGLSPAGSRQTSRGSSPAPAWRSLPPGAGVQQQHQRSRSAGPERPHSAQRFDPTEYVRLQRSRQLAAAVRMEEARRQQRLQQRPSSSRPASRPQSLPPSRRSSVPSSRHSTPMRSRDPSAERSRPARDARSGSRERAAVASSMKRLRGAMATTHGIPPREQRAASPGRALQEVKARLSQYAAQTGGSKKVPLGVSSKQPAGAGVQPPVLASASPARQRPLATGDNILDATSEIADIDARLQSLQAFLKAAKSGQAAKAPA